MAEFRSVVDTPLARWLQSKMDKWEDPETGMAGLSGNNLANLCGVSQAKIWSILKVGGAEPRASTLIRLAEFFGEPPLTLFRLAYLEGDQDTGLSPEVRAKLAELESALHSVPPAAQVHFLESMLSQIRVLQAAAAKWEA